MIITALYRAMKQRFSAVVVPPAAPPSHRIQVDTAAVHRVRANVNATHRVRADATAVYRITVESV